MPQAALQSRLQAPRFHSPCAFQCCHADFRSASVETPALCHVVPAETTSKPCESVAEYRTRLSLPYLLRRTSLLPAAGEEHAKYQSANTASRLASDASETLTSGDEPFGFEARPGF